MNTAAEAQAVNGSAVHKVVIVIPREEPLVYGTARNGQLGTMVGG